MESKSDPLKIKNLFLFSDDFLIISDRLSNLVLLISRCEEPVECFVIGSKQYIEPYALLLAEDHVLWAFNHMDLVVDATKWVAPIFVPTCTSHTSDVWCTERHAERLKLHPIAQRVCVA